MSLLPESMARFSDLAIVHSASARVGEDTAFPSAPGVHSVNAPDPFVDATDTRAGIRFYAA